MSVRLPATLSRTAGLLAATAGAVVVATASPAAAALPSFGTAPVSGAGSGGQTVLTSVTVGHHSGFDRVVFTSRLGIGAYEVRYVTQVTNDPKGTPVGLLGSAFLEVTFRGTRWTTHPAPQPTITPRFPALRQVKGAGEFEAVAHYGLGQASKTGFRAFTMTGPNRLVVDVAAPAGDQSASSGAAAGGTTSGAETSGGTTSTGATGGDASTGAGGLADTGTPIAPVIWVSLGLLAAGGVTIAAVMWRRRLA